MKLKVRPVTSSHSPQTTSPVRTGSVRAARRVSHSPAASRTRAAGGSQATWPPTSEPTIRRRPGAPPRPTPPPAPAAAARADLVTGEAPEAVVAQRQLEDGVGLRA